MNSNIIALNLEEDILIGWESKVNDKLVELVTEGIRLGFEFPEICVYKLADNTYCLDPNYMVTVKDDKCTRDGGHTRAVGHLIYPARIKVYVKEGEPQFFPEKKAKDIRDCLLVEDEKQYQQQIKMFPKYKQIIAQMARR